MSDNAFYTCVTAAFLAGFLGFVGGLTGYFVNKNKVALEMVRAGADPIKVRALMEGERILYVERPAQ